MNDSDSKFETPNQIIHAEVLAYLLHDMRSGLVNARNAAEMLRLEVSATGTDSDRTRILLKDIVSGIKRCEQIVDQARYIGRDVTKQSNKKPLSLSTLSRLVFEVAEGLTGQNRRIEVRFPSKGRDLVVFSDPIWLTVALTSILMNAVEHSISGEHVYLDVKIMSSKVSFSVRNLTNSPVKDFESWVQPAFSTLPNKAGYGLTVTKELLSELGSELSISYLRGPFEGQSWVQIGFDLEIER